MGIRPGQAKGPAVSSGDEGGAAFQTVISLYDPTSALPTLPTVGDTYIAAATGNGWTGGYIYTWTGVTWREVIPVEGMVRFASLLNLVFIYTDGLWKVFPEHWVVPILSFYDNTTALPFPGLGDRYIAIVTANGWTANRIYQWDGTQWVEQIPAEGTSALIDDIRAVYRFIDGTWNLLDTPWLDPVISIFDNTAALPVAPTVGDRYIAKVTANGWTINRIYEWSVSLTWVQTIPVAGNMTYVAATGFPYLYGGSSWVEYQPLSAHTFGGPMHDADTIANIQSKVSDGSLITSAAGEYGAFPAKGSPDIADLVLIEDSENADAKTKVALGDLPKQIIYGTSATPPAPAGYPDGTVYMQYLA